MASAHSEHTLWPHPNTSGCARKGSLQVGQPRKGASADRSSSAACTARREDAVRLVLIVRGMCGAGKRCDLLRVGLRIPQKTMGSVLACLAKQRVVMHDPHQLSLGRIPKTPDVCSGGRRCLKTDTTRGVVDRPSTTTSRGGVRQLVDGPLGWQCPKT